MTRYVKKLLAEVFPCPRCGVAVQRKTRVAMCDRCAKQRKRESDARRGQRAQARQAGSIWRCEHCGKAVAGSGGRKVRFCDPICARRTKNRVWSPGPTRCTECSATFVPSLPYQKYCSSRCKERPYDRKRNATRGRLMQISEVVDPFVVFARDKWTCQLCGVKTPKKLRGTYDPRAPELDHIIPVTKDGEHSYRNTQCACRACNGAKGNKELGQLRLVG